MSRTHITPNDVRHTNPINGPRMPDGDFLILLAAACLGVIAVSLIYASC